MRKVEDEVPPSYAMSFNGSNSSSTTTLPSMVTQPDSISIIDICNKRNLGRLKQFVAHRGRDAVRFKDEHDGTTALHHAAWNGDREAVIFLLQQGADVDARNNEGSTPLHWAAWNGNLEVARLLLACGADPCAATTAGDTWYCTTLGWHNILTLGGYTHHSP